MTALRIVPEPFLVCYEMDGLESEVRQDCPWTMMFADDMLISSKSKEQVDRGGGMCWREE